MVLEADQVFMADVASGLDVALAVVCDLGAFVLATAADSAQRYPACLDLRDLPLMLRLLRCLLVHELVSHRTILVLLA